MACRCRSCGPWGGEAVIGELRAQERRECRGDCEAIRQKEHEDFYEVNDSWDVERRCDGCNGDGTRWVTVGSLRLLGPWSFLNITVDVYTIKTEASDGWRKARGVVPAGEPSEVVIRRMRDGAS